MNHVQTGRSCSYPGGCPYYGRSGPVEVKHMYDTENSVLIRTNFTCPLDSTLPGRQVITDAGASLESHAGHDAITSSPERVASSLPSPRMQGVRSAQAASKEKSKQEKSKILLVEDDADILQVLCVFLKYA